MILTDLIDVYYSPDIINNKNKYTKLKESINSIEIDNILNINDKIRNKFFIIVTENNTKIKTTLDPILEQYISDDIDSNNINNESEIAKVTPNEFVDNNCNNDGNATWDINSNHLIKNLSLEFDKSTVFDSFASEATLAVSGFLLVFERHPVGPVGRSSTPSCIGLCHLLETAGRLPAIALWRSQSRLR